MYNASVDALLSPTCRYRETATRYDRRRKYIDSDNGAERARGEELRGSRRITFRVDGSEGREGGSIRRDRSAVCARHRASLVYATIDHGDKESASNNVNDNNDIQ